jgi:type II secretory pathway pseudopilin PulG
VPLAEALFGLLILGLMAAVAIPPMVHSSDKRTAQCEANVALLNSMIERHAAKHGGWPPHDKAEFDRMVADDNELPSGEAPQCPYGRRYEYDPAGGRVVKHAH